MPKNKDADQRFLDQARADIPAVHAAFKNSRLLIKLQEIQREHLQRRGIVATWETTEDNMLIVRVKPKEDDDRQITEVQSFAKGIENPTIENEDYMQELDIDTRARTSAFFSVMANVLVNVGYLKFGVTDLDWKDQYARAYWVAKQRYEQNPSEEI